MQLYLSCLKAKGDDYFPCKQLSRSYLQCRMDRNLMKEEDLSQLGLGEDGSYTRVDPNAGKRESEGFVAGMHRTSLHFTAVHFTALLR